MIGLRAADCRRLATGLTALAAEGELAPDRDTLLEHLDRCPACRMEFQTLTLTAIAVRRLGQAAPDPQTNGRSGWLRLRARIERSRASAAILAWRWRATLGGLAASTLVVAALAAPLALSVRLGGSGAERVGYEPRELDLLNRRIEASYVAGARNGVLAPIELPSTTQTIVLRRYPDAVLPPVKEVPSRPIGHSPTAD